MSCSTKTLHQEQLQWPQLPDHQIRMAFQFDYALEKGQEQRRIYLSFALGQQIDTKTDTFIPSQTKWSCSHDISVSLEFLQALYNKPCEFIVWEIVRGPDDAEIIKGHAAGRVIRDKPKKTALERMMDKKAAAKPTQSTTEVKPNKQKKKGLHQPSLANTGWTKKKEPPKPSESIQETTQGFGHDWFDTAIRKLRPRSASDPGKIKSSFQYNEYEKRESPPPEPSIADQWSDELVLLPPQHPHHFDHPEKYIPPPATARSIPSRTSSSLSDIAIARSKTPPSPHHFDHPLATVIPNGTLPIVKIQKKDIKQGNKEVKGIKNRLKKNKPPQMVAEKERPPSSKSSDERRIRWDHETKGVRHTYWNDVDPNSVNRKANDQTIEGIVEKPIGEKRKGDHIHVPLGKIKMDLTPLFMGGLEVHVDLGSVVSGLSRCDIKVRLDAPLLNDVQSRILNPLMITLGTLFGLPNEPIDYKTLDATCLPVYTRFQFYNDPYIHKTACEQSRKERMSLDAHHVILAGLLDSKQLHDLLIQGPMEIQVHDRAYKHPKDVALLRAILNENGIITQDMNPQHPFGVASLNMEELLEGKLQFKSKVPVLPAPPKSKTLMAPGEWIKSFTTLSVKVEVMYPLFPQEEPTFSRLAIMDRLSNRILAQDIVQEVLRINAQALSLDCPEEEREMMLKSLPVSNDQIVSGFHLFDPQFRVFFLQGPVQQLKTLQEKAAERGAFSFLDKMQTYRQLDPTISNTLMHYQMESVDDALRTRKTYLTGSEFKTIHLLQRISQRETFNWPQRLELHHFLQLHADPAQFGQSLIETPDETKLSIETLNEQPQMAMEAKTETRTRKQISKTIHQNKDWYRVHVESRLRAPNFVQVRSKKPEYTPKYFATLDQTVFNYSCQTYKHKIAQD